MESTELEAKTTPLVVTGNEGPTALGPSSAAIARGSSSESGAIEALPTGSVLGRYVILTTLGEGGMGVVYAAYDPELDRKIALKLLRDFGNAAGNEQARTRMLREAQAMARLSHPNVIAVHDVGIVDGRVFIAMEFVDGMTLRAWLGAEKRTLPEIIAMFTQAGRGLAAAHGQSIVHRDFKPDNVLVGKDGRARVLDFGLAHSEAAANAVPIFDRAAITGNDLPLVLPEGTAVRSQNPAWDAKITQAGVVIGTPAYMSAEQFTGKTTDARTDQFSFCAALYEALYGEMPYRAENLKELARAVYHGAMQPEPTGRRVPKKIRQALLRGLLPKKEERFASMEALLQAIQIEPERNARTWIVLAAALLIGAVGIGLTFKTREDPGAVCRTSPQKLSGIWDGERKRTIEKAFLATDKPFAQDAYKNLERTLDDYTDKWVAMRTDACLATRVRGEQSAELFDLRMQCLNHHLTDLHALTDILVQGGAEIVEKSGLASRALSGFEGCANVEVLRSVVPPPKDEATRKKVESIRQQLAEARALEWAGRFKDEATIMDKLTADVGQIKYRPIEAEVYALAARAQNSKGFFKEAHSLAMNAIFAAEAGRHDELAADVWIRLATWQSVLEGDELERARMSAGHASALVERMGGHDSLQADVDTARGNIEYEAGNYQKAREYYQAALATRERLLGAEATEVARTIENLAMVARYQGHHEQALTYSRRALALLEKNVGPQHPFVSKTLTTIGLTLEGKGEFAEARKVHERALAITEKTYGPEHSNMAIGLMNLANTVGELGDADEAITLYTRALRIQEKKFGVGHAKTSNILQNIGATLEGEQRHQDALPYFERALAIQEKAKGRDYVEHCLPLSNMGMTLIYLKRYDEALASFNRALDLARKTHGDKHPYIADALFGIGSVYLEQHQAQKGLPLLEEALIMRTTLDEDPLLIANSRYQLGRAFWESGKDKPHGLELVREALKSLQAGSSRSKRTVDEIETWLRTHNTH